MKNIRLITLIFLLGITNLTNTKQPKIKKTHTPIYQIAIAGVSTTLPAGYRRIMVNFNGRQHVYNMPSNATISDLKDRIVKRTGYDDDAIVLTYQSKELRGNQKLKNLPNLEFSSISMTIVPVKD